MTAQLDREKLANILGMLGSDHDGEVLAAARQAERMRQDACTTWPDIICLVPDEVAGDPLKAVFELLANVRYLTERELDFAISIKHQDCDCSPHQIAEIERLLRKVRRAQGRAAT